MAPVITGRRATVAHMLCTANSVDGGSRVESCHIREGFTRGGSFGDEAIHGQATRCLLRRRFTKSFYLEATEPHRSKQGLGMVQHTQRAVGVVLSVALHLSLGVGISSGGPDELCILATFFVMPWFVGFC